MVLNILLADDHGLFRDSMSAWLMQLDDHVHIQHASSFDEVVTIMQLDCKLALILLDLYMPGMQGPSSVVKIHHFAKGTPIAMMSADENPDIIKRCIKAGAVGYLPKSASGPITLDAIRILLAGGSYLPITMIDLGADFPSLNNKQHQILILMTEGLSNKEIAYKCNLAEGTVKQYVSEILKKLQVHNRTQAGIKAKELGLFRG